MANVGNFCLYMVAVASCCLSVLNHFRYEALKNSIDLQEHGSNGFHSRQRRGTAVEVNGTECKCAGPRGERGLPGLPGPRGETGLRGPPGEKGKAGLGLFPPALRSKVIHLTTNASQDEVMSCTFFGNPVPHTRWEATASNTEVETKIDHEKSEIKTSLHIRNISWDDRGNVSCFASSILGEVRENGLLTVHVPPIIDLPSGPLIAFFGSTFTFPECKVISSPPAEVTWRRGFRMSPNVRIANNNGVLRILDVKVQDEGYYECIAKNYLGTTRKFIQLRTRPMEFSMKPPFYVYESNSSTTLICAASGPPGGMFGRWSRFIGEAHVPYTTSQNGNELVVSMVVEKSGKYKCTITNNVTTIESFTEVDIFKINSSIMNNEQTHTLGTWLRNKDRIGEYKLCWSGRLHGLSARTFHNRCDGKPNTISIFKSNGGAVFGGFTDIPWRTFTSRTQGYSSESFIFTFQNTTRMIPMLNKNMAICYYKHYGPCFGDGELYLVSTRFGVSYKSKLDFGGNGIEDIEVFYMI